MALQRRSVLQGMTAAGLTAGLSGLGSGTAAAKGSPAAAGPNWSEFDKAVRAEFARQKLVGAGIAIVSSDRVLHQLTMGARRWASGPDQRRHPCPRRVDDEIHVLAAGFHLCR